LSVVKKLFKQSVVDGGLKLFKQGLTVGTWGNLSIRDPETNLFYIKPSGMRYPEIRVDDIVVMDNKKEIIEGFRKPSIEYNFHIAIMNAREDVNCVMHYHPVYSSVFGVINEDIPGIGEDFVQLVGDKIINCDYALPGTPELAENVVKGLGDRNAVIIPNHGSICVGTDFDTTLKTIHVVEKTAHIYILAQSMGKTSRLIHPDDIAAMQDFARNHYGQGK
jgi:L-fuculose-phosphate aldolase